MKRPLRKLPAGKRRELDHAVSILRETFAATVATRRAPRLRDGKILKIILFGSYARGDWVHDPVGRYFSDFDLLAIPVCRPRRRAAPSTSIWRCWTTRRSVGPRR